MTDRNRGPSYTDEGEWQSATARQTFTVFGVLCAAFITGIAAVAAALWGLGSI